MDRRSGKLTRMASTVLDERGVKRQTTSSGEGAAHLRSQGTMGLRTQATLAGLLLTDPTGINENDLDDFEDEDDLEPTSAFQCMGANSHFGRIVSIFFGHSPTPAYMLMLSLSVILYIGFENLTMGSKSCALTLGIFFGISVGLLVATFCLRGIWLGCLRIVYLENRIFPALNELLDPDIWILVWTLLIDAFWSAFAVQVFNTKGLKTGYHRYKMIPITWPLQYIEDRYVQYIHLCLIVQIFWAIRNILVEILMYQILLGFLTNFRKPVLDYLNQYALLRKLNAAWVKLTPVPPKPEGEASFMQADTLENVIATSPPFPSASARQESLRKRKTRFITPKAVRQKERNMHVQYTGRNLPTVLEKQNIKSVEVSSVANLLSVQWIKTNPMVLFVEGDRCELISKRVAKVVARMLFHELLAFRTSLTRMTSMLPPMAGGMSNMLSPASLPMSPKDLVTSPTGLGDPVVPPSDIGTTDGSKIYRISVQDPGQSVTDRIAVNLGIKNVEDVDDDTDDEIRNALPPMISQRPPTQSIESLRKRLKDGQPLVQASVPNPEAMPQSDPYIDSTRAMDVHGSMERTNRRRSTMPSVGAAAKAPATGPAREPLDLMPLLLQRRRSSSSVVSPPTVGRSPQNPQQPQFTRSAEHHADRPAPTLSSESESGIDFHELNAPVMPVQSHSVGGVPTEQSHTAARSPSTQKSRWFSRHKDGKKDKTRFMQNSRSGQMSDRKVAEVAAEEIRALRLITAADKDCLTRDFLALFIKPRELDDLMRMLDPSKMGKVTEKSFVKGVMNVHHNRSQMVSSLEAQAEIERVFHRVASIFLTFLIFLCFLLVLGVSTNTIIISGAAALSASGVVMSFVYTDFIVSIILIVFLNPYSIGDQMVLDGVMMTVRKITTYFTEFVGGDGKIVYLSHKQLSTMKLINQSRGISAAWGFVFRVSDQMTFAQYDYLTRVLENYLKSKPLEWKPDLFIHIMNVQPYQYAEINIWVTCVEPWASPSIWLAKSRFMNYVLRQCRLMGLSYGQATLPIQVSKAGTGEAPNSDHQHSSPSEALLSQVGVHEASLSDLPKIMTRGNAMRG